MKVLELNKVYYKQGNFLLKDISFGVEQGEWVALTGESGSGKSTLIRVIGNGVESDCGVLSYWGKELYQNEQEIRKQISIVYDEPNFNVDYPAKKLAKEIAKFEPWFDMDYFDKKMKFFGLDPEKRIKHFSTGMKKKYMLILALCRKPQLLILDEVTSGIDSNGRNAVWSMIKEHSGITVIFSSHYKDEVETYATRRIRLKDGGMA